VGYLFFLPTMLVGPINRAAPYFEDRRTHGWRFGDLLVGVERMLYGYAKITVLSGLLVNRWIRGYASTLPQDGGAQTYVLVVANSLDLYFLFAGYSDIAIGFARLLGYRILENFNWPYFRKNISDFWRAWHISLSSWCRDYIYLPVVGATRNPYLGTLATFIVIGLWHELSIRYILWGLWHGAGILGWRKLQELKYRWRLPRARSRLAVSALNVMSVVLTFHYVALGLVIVSGKSLSGASATYRNLLVGW
jgi:alginate O-acetyltransferase complex protein AlgI